MAPKTAPPYPNVEGRLGGSPLDKERRRRDRMQVHWSVSFLPADNGEYLETITHDLSSDGFYCFSKAAFVPGDSRDCTLRVPTHSANGSSRLVSVQCRVRVIRVEARTDSGLYGVGFWIEDYRVNLCEPGPCFDRYRRELNPGIASKDGANFPASAVIIR